MLGSIVVILTALGLPIGESNAGGDVANALALLRQLPKTRKTRLVTFEMKEQKWWITELVIGEDELIPPTPQVLSQMTGLESLKLTVPPPNTKAVQGLQQLIGLKHLRRLSVPSFASACGIENLMKSMPNLEEIEINYGLADGEPQMFPSLMEIPKLRRLDLEHTGLRDNHLAFIKALHRLEVLNLRQNPWLTDRVMAELKGLTNLRDLRLGGTRISEASIPLLREMRQLESLDVGWDLGHGDPEAATVIDLSGLRRLKTIELGVTSLCGRNMPAVLLPKSLIEIKLYVHVTEGIRVPEWMQRPRYVNLGLYLTPDRSMGALDALEPLRNLSELTLAFPGKINVPITPLIGIRSLRGLSFQGICEMIGVDDFKRVAQIRQLDTLEIQADHGVGVLRSLTGLHRLRIFIGQATTEELGFLRNLKQLRSLDIPVCKTIIPIDSVLDYLRGMEKLEELTIGETKLTDAGLKKLVGLKKLRSLDLRYASGYSDEGLGFLMRESKSLQVISRSYEPEEGCPAK